ncbi:MULTISPECIES: lycopene beta cyclase [Prochlorococcus]|uniref:lycopene beta cyclase n=1 Tax=Prochlorococcus TaxID=1218 RepID=UPI000533A380|nr:MULTISPECIES: lycopene cyclase family protein [Prochlorococcus]KGG12598.1 Lycopene epsilon cyclase [Prochlorococcus sp. MIT 0601]
MSSNAHIDALVLGAGPGALAIAAALGNENLSVYVLSPKDRRETWPYTYGIWGEEVDELGISNLLKHRWTNTVSFFGRGSQEPNSPENAQTNHSHDYGLFDKGKLQSYWLKQCDDAKVKWVVGLASNLKVDNSISRVTTSTGITYKARLVIDATGYHPVFLKIPDRGEVAVQTCFGIVGTFTSPPIENDQFVLMDYRSDHLSPSERKEPPTFLYAMDMGNGKFFLEETSLGLAPPVSLETLKARLEKRLSHKGIKIKEIEHEEHGLFLPMNIPIPDLKQPILGFGGAAGMVHPASGYLVGALLRRAPDVAKAISLAMNDKENSPALIAKHGWEALWPKDLRRKQALYQFGLEKLMRFKESQLRQFFDGFFSLSKSQWYGFLTNSLTLGELVEAMWTMFKKAPLNVKWGLFEMKGREVKLLLKFLNPSI